MRGRNQKILGSEQWLCYRIFRKYNRQRIRLPCPLLYVKRTDIQKNADFVLWLGDIHQTIAYPEESR